MSDSDLRKLTSFCKLKIAQAIFFSEEGPPTKIISDEKTQVYLANNLKWSALIKACREA